MTTFQSPQIRIATEATRSVARRPLCCSVSSSARCRPRSHFPEAQISNGQITAKMYLPDARNGYYRSTRFDWSARSTAAIRAMNSTDLVRSIDPKSSTVHHDRISFPAVQRADGTGERIERVPGWNETNSAGHQQDRRGVLQRPAELTNTLPDVRIPASGRSRRQRFDRVHAGVVRPECGCHVYRKVARLAKDKLEMVLEHSSRILAAAPSRVPLATTLSLDEQRPTGPRSGCCSRFICWPPNKELVEVRERSSSETAGRRG
jgi:hypothetical protein